jgi:hypothetical protein
VIYGINRQQQGDDSSRADPRERHKQQQGQLEALQGKKHLRKQVERLEEGK